MKKRIRKYVGNSLLLKQKREKAWKDANRQKGLCSCGKNAPVPGKKKCQKCMSTNNLKRKEIRDKRKKKGLCPECNNTADKGTLCIACKKLQKTAIAVLRKQRIDKKICIRCGKTQPQHNILYCLTCTLKGISWRLWKDKKRWQELLDLFNNQNGICPYFKEPIAIGLNASIDHKLPKKLGGSNEISNLQWVHHAANTMKWDFTEEEFFDHIKKLFCQKLSK